MKFFEKRGVALVVLVLAIAGAVFIGQSRKDGFIAKKPTELLDVQYQDWICDEAGLLNGQTEQLIRDYNDSWNSKYYAITAVASIDHLTGWDAEDYAANLGEKWGAGTQRHDTAAGEGRRLAGLLRRQCGLHHDRHPAKSAAAGH